MPPSRWRTHAVTLISTPGGPAFPTGEPAEFDSAAEHCVCRARTASIGAAQGAPPPCSIDIASLSGPTPGACMSSAVDTAADRPTPQGDVGRSAPYQYALLMDRNRQGENNCQRSCPTPGMRCSAATPKVARVGCEHGARSSAGSYLRRSSGAIPVRGRAVRILAPALRRPTSYRRLRRDTYRLNVVSSNVIGSPYH